MDEPVQRQLAYPPAGDGPAEPALPAGWELGTNPDGRPYYFRRDTNETTWARPTAATASPVEFLADYLRANKPPPKASSVPEAGEPTVQSVVVAIE